MKLTTKVPDKLRIIAREILPPLITRPIRRYEKLQRQEELRLQQERQWCLGTRGESSVQEARQHFEQATRVSGTDKLPLSNLWLSYAQKMRDAINTLTRPQEVINYAQTGKKYDHRDPAFKARPYMNLYESTLKSEFPHFPHLIDELGDSPYSDPDTLLKYGGRLISNVSYLTFRYILQCLAHVKDPRVVCEIGGGYGDPARLWLQNSIFRPSCYVDVDLPESLFLAEVFLRVNFDDLKLLYVTNPTKLEPDVVSQYSVILCPINFVDAISDLPLDLVINTVSMQEMTDEWVDFWMQRLREWDCRWYYSLNFFAQPLDGMAAEEVKSTWIPRLTPEWTVRMQTFNPAFMKLYTLCNYAEVLAQKESRVSSVSKQELISRYKYTKDRILDGQVLLEAMDIVRLSWDEDIMWDLLLRCLAEMPKIPREAWWLAKYLEKHASPAFHTRNGEELQNICQKLDLVRSSGIEDYSPKAY